MRRFVVLTVFLLALSAVAALALHPTPGTIAFMQALTDFTQSGWGVAIAATVMMGGAAAAIAHCGVVGALVGIGFAAFMHWVPPLLLAAMLSVNGATPSTEQQPTSPAAPASASSKV